MKTRILLIGLVSTLLFFSDCDFGIGDDMDLGLGNMWPYLYYDLPDSLYNYPTYRSHIYINPISIDFYGNLSATLYFSAIADTTVVIESINCGIDDMENVEQRFYNRKIDFHIVNITPDDCMEDIYLKPNSVSFTMEKDQVYNFCFYVNNLEKDSFSFLYGYFYHHILSNEPTQQDSSDFYFEFITPD